MPETENDIPVRASQIERSARTAANSKSPVSHPSHSDFARPQSWARPITVTPEAEALQSLKNEWRRQSRDQPTGTGVPAARPLVIVDVHDFEIYREPSNVKRAYELTSLHFLEVPQNKKLCFNGFICVGMVRRYIQGVLIHDCSIEGYGNGDSPKVVAYLQSIYASKDQENEIWYRLNKPAATYQKFHAPFLWIAQLGKHVLDYIEERQQQQPPYSITLSSFRTNFHIWLTNRFSGKPDFQQWNAEFNQTDFRVAVHAYIEYIYNQAFNLSKQLLNHPLWAECMTKGLTIVEPQQVPLGYTLATPDVYASFKHMYFSKRLREKRPVYSVQIEQERRKYKLGFAKNQAVESEGRCRPYSASLVKKGDVVGLIPEERDQVIWKDTNWDWLAYVQDTQLLDDGTQRLFVLWIYRPHETNVFKAEYIYKNEVFLSDNCNCKERELLSTEIKGKYDVDWCPAVIQSGSTHRFFIRQTYTTQDSAFVTVRDEHKTCVCRKSKDLFPYHSGDTVYLTRTLQGEEILDPFLIHSVNKFSGLVTVRKLLRLQRDCAELIKAHRSVVLPNELVLTDEYKTLTLTTSLIQRRCFVKFISRDDLVDDRPPFPYSLGGAGDLWFISMGLSRHMQRLIYLRHLPSVFNQGLQIEPYRRKLRGLSIFSGGGSLDRGLEEGGAVEFHNAVDLSPEACHTQRANAEHHLHIYCGSVDNYFDAVLTGKDSQLIARVGEVDLIAAGSPCPGFSTLQQNPLSPSSIRNASHVSTFSSFVDVYRPLYGILENVINMASTRKDKGQEQNVLSQVVASLVSMGYQVNQYIMDAWCYSSSQQRSRLIITIAAPGLNPILQPQHTHRRPYEDTQGRCLGWLPSGQRFGQREYYPTPFSHVPARSIGAGLPDIGNSIVQTCIPFPDHRLSALSTRGERALLTCIPKSPPGCGYNEADKLGLIPESLKRPVRGDGRPYTRIKEAGLVPTITTSVKVRDKYNGASVHWREDRPISIMDARRAQGYPDHEPIIGSPAKQFEIVGNGVDRMVSFAIGLALFHATDQNASDFTANGRTLATSIGRLSLSSNTQALTTPAKRIRVQETKERPAKRSKPNQRSRSFTGTASDTSNREQSSMSRSERSASLSVERRTRHSGLAVEFVPKQWNKKPEKEHDNSS